MGYQDAALKNATGYSFICPTFCDVGNGQRKADLQSIKIKGSNGLDDTKIICYNESALLAGREYIWWTEDGYGYPDGWYNQGSEQLITDVSLNQGEGLYLYTTNPDVSLQFAGQVSEAVTNGVASAGYNIVGNCSPVEIDLQDLKIIGSNGLDDTKIIGYNESALLAGVEYIWWTEDGYGYPDGWYNQGSEQLITGIKLQPGEGVYLYTTNPNIKYVIPSPLK